MVFLMCRVYINISTYDWILYASKLTIWEGGRRVMETASLWFTAFVFVSLWDVRHFVRGMWCRDKCVSKTHAWHTHTNKFKLTRHNSKIVWVTNQFLPPLSFIKHFNPNKKKPKHPMISDTKIKVRYNQIATSLHQWSAAISGSNRYAHHQSWRVIHKKNGNKQTFRSFSTSLQMPQPKGEQKVLTRDSDLSENGAPENKPITQPEREITLFTLVIRISGWWMTRRISSVCGQYQY